MGPPLGPLSADDIDGASWRRRAGTVAGYREALAITGDADPIGPVPPPGCPDARAWWWRAAAALDGRGAASLASVPDERLEALVEEVRRADLGAPEPAADQLRAAEGGLRAARTAAGLAIVSGGPKAVADASRRVVGLTAAVAGAEAAQARREVWRVATSRAHAHAAAAEAEMAARRVARAAEPLAHLGTEALERQVRAAGRMLATACRVTARCDERRAAAGRDVTEAGAEQLEAVRADELAAARGAELEVVLGHRRLGIHVVRGHQRAGLSAELGALSARRAAAPAATASRDMRWARLLADGAAADDAALARATGRLARALPAVAEHAASVTAARATERDLRASASRLGAELDRRAGVAPGPGPGGQAWAQGPTAPRLPDLHHRAAVLVEGAELSEGPVLAP